MGRKRPRRRVNEEQISPDGVPRRNVLFANYSLAPALEGSGPIKREKSEAFGHFMLEPRLAGLVVVTAVLAEMPNGGARNGVGVTHAAGTTDGAAVARFYFVRQSSRDELRSCAPQANRRGPKIAGP
jgi:hypothetical protein